MKQFRKIMTVMMITTMCLSTAACGGAVGNVTEEATEYIAGNVTEEATEYVTEGTVENPTESTADETAKAMTTMQVVRDMGIGINLGNTFEACGDWIDKTSVTNYETAWGSPVITKAMIEGYAKEGFKTLRIPVAWSNMMKDNYQIAPELMARVKEVVSWAIECDMYVIVNIHWDGGWWEDFPLKKEECMTKYKTVWQQIAREFAMYDHRLILESLNEEGGWLSLWNHYGNTEYGKAESYGLLNEINQTFVDLVRSSGYNNSDRHLLIAGYMTDIKLTCDKAWVMPKDDAGRCAVSVHYYTPAGYCILTENQTWGNVKTTWGSNEDKAELLESMNLLKDTWVDKGIPVIIGEFGCVLDNKDKHDATQFLTAVAQEAYNCGICPVLWDITGNYSVYDRKSCRITEYTELRDNFNRIVGQKQ